jgi:flagellar biosynthesis protein FlhF
MTAPQGSDPASLAFDAMAKAEADGADILLVDTAGHSAQDPTTRQVFDRLAGRPGVRTNLVVPAWSSRRELERLIAAFETARPDRLVLTRLDEVESLAPLLGPLRACRIPIALLGTGQRVPEDLERASADRMAAWALGELSA